VFSLELPRKGIPHKLSWKHRMYKEFSYSAGSLKKQSAPKMQRVGEPTFEVFLTNAVYVCFTTQNHGNYFIAQKDNAVGRDNVSPGYLSSCPGIFTAFSKNCKI